jgi:ABC-type phosphate transport system substrate-binding protein
MRKTSDLVNEMQKEAKNAYLVAIAVGFENETRFVFSSQKQPLQELNQMVQRGGSPIGLLRFEKENLQIQGSFRPFEEYADQEWAKNYLAGLLDNTREIIGMSQQQSFPTAY